MKNKYSVIKEFKNCMLAYMDAGDIFVYILLHNEDATNQNKKTLVRAPSTDLRAVI
jgi:hypothetical protein